MQPPNAKRRSRRTPQEGDQGYRTKPPPWKVEPRRGSSKRSQLPVSISHSFATRYVDLCKQHHLRPLSVVTVSLPHKLDFSTDRIKIDDWSPILNSLSLDQSLSSVRIRSRYQARKPLEEVNSDQPRVIGKTPAVLTRYLLEWLSHSVAHCARNSSALTCLELEGIPLPPDCLAVLCMGLSATKSLQHFSLQRCHIGDNSCELVCRTVADVHSIRSLNLGQCDLTVHSGSILASALSRQKISLYHDTWQQSLRYREPNIEAMPGLRRLTLNGNPLLGDLAASEVIEAVRDSLWLKALDLQNCGLTDHVAKEFIELLKYNVTLAIVDVRMNAVSEDLLREIAEALQRNNNGDPNEYRWLCIPRGERPVPATRESNVRRKVIQKDVMAKNNAGYQANLRPCRQVPPQRKMVPVARTSQGRNNRPLKTNGSLPRGEGIVVRVPTMKNPEYPSRPSLRVDLQSRISRTEGDPEEKAEVGNRGLEDPTKSRLEARRVILRQLTEAKVRQEQLLEEARRNYNLLAEERLRREVAEAKLRTTRENLAEVEAALKRKEEESRGSLLVSQQSLDEICSAFESLLETLDSVTRNPRPRKDSDEELTRKTIKQQIALLVRKTKSEGIPRPSQRYHDPDDLVRPTELTNKFTKSETDLRSRLPAISLSRFERNIGDSPGVMSPSREEVRPRDSKVTESPEARARAIFAQFVSEGSPLAVGFHVS